MKETYMNNDIYMNGGQTASIQMVADFDGDINSSQYARMVKCQ